MAKQPARGDGDGEIQLERRDDGKLCLSCVTDGERTMVRMGEFNAWRAFGLLAVFLGISLPTKLSKSIQLGD